MFYWLFSSWFNGSLPLVEIMASYQTAAIYENIWRKKFSYHNSLACWVKSDGDPLKPLFLHLATRACKAMQSDAMQNYSNYCKSNFCHFSGLKHVNEKQTYWLNPGPQMWPSGLTLAITLTLNFQGKIWNLLYLNQKWSNCHEMESKRIDWTPGLKCDQWVWPWPWPWPLNFQGQTWTWPLTTHMTLTMDFHGQIFSIAVSQNGRADWHWTEGVGVGHSWPGPWPFGDQGQV